MQIQDEIKNVTERFREGTINLVEATGIFEDLVLRADQEVAPLLATGNKNYAAILNSLLGELRAEIKAGLKKESLKT